MTTTKSAGHTGTWDPDIYLRFAAYRARPLADLLPRLKLDLPGDIYDLGCGPGNLTIQLKARWPERRVVGLDSSPDMLRKARESYADSDIDWRDGDIATWRADKPAALVFANASLHWVHDHAALFPRLMREVAPGGVLAVQMPMTTAAQYQACIRNVKAMPKWRARLSAAEPHADPEAAGFYYDVLAPLADVEVWETNYLHVLKGAHPVTDWMLGTGLVPILSVLDETEKAAFLEDYNDATEAAYPRQGDGAVLLDMRRLFIVAKRKG